MIIFTFCHVYLEHGGLRTSQLVERRFACRHFDDRAPQGPDVSRLPITPRPLVYNLWGHVLKRSCSRETKQEVLV